MAVLSKFVGAHQTQRKQICKGTMTMETNQERKDWGEYDAVYFNLCNLNDDYWCLCDKIAYY